VIEFLVLVSVDKPSGAVGGIVSSVLIEKVSDQSLELSQISTALIFT
jgi:hypothetical protein